jgi:hypothetical protein
LFVGGKLGQKLMKLPLLRALSIICLIAVFGVITFSADVYSQPEQDNSAVDSQAVENPSVASDNADEDVKKAGLWREGKAVFSDVEVLDIFWKYSRGYKPIQPINYNHQIHVEKNNMECQYCHSGVAKSPFATMPSVELCMGCHKTVRADTPEIKKLAEHYENKTPVEWEPVNHLPEHVIFTHERHIKAGVGCQNCHGQVQKMDVVEKVSSLKMGFCVSCHRDKGASIDCMICHY